MSGPYRTSDPPESVPDPFPSVALQPFSGLFPTCRKCQHKHYAGTVNRYVVKDDSLERKCVSCGFAWRERAADSGGA